MSDTNDTNAVPTELAALEAMSGAPPASGPEISIEQLITPTASAPAAPAGLDVLATMADGPTAVTGTGQTTNATDSYGFDKTLAEQGKWVPWPKLGPNAKLLLAKTQNKKWKFNLGKLRAKYADDTGNIETVFFIDNLLGPLMVKSVFLGMTDVMVELGAPALQDDERTRLKLFEDFEGCKDDVLAYCSKATNFRNTEAVTKNS
jgi:hypothetical protein